MQQQPQILPTRDEAAAVAHPNVSLYDESHGVFGELLGPETVRDGLRRMEDGDAAPDLHSSTESVTATPLEQQQGSTLVEWDNATRWPVTVRLMMDQQQQQRTRLNRNAPGVRQQMWTTVTTVDPFTSTVHWAQLDQLFVMIAAAECTVQYC